MIRAKSILDRWGGLILHLSGAFVVFITWRLLGMPAPGSLGRLIPLCWLITGIVYGRGGITRHTPVILIVFVLLSLLWTTSPEIELFASSAGLLGIFPGLLHISRKKTGVIRAVLIILPMIAILPFSGDEPHYATLTEDLVAPGAGVFGNMRYQMGDPTENISHHQILYPALMIPGYPFGVPGIKGMNVLFALASALLLAELLRRSGIQRWNYLAVLSLLTIPGSSILGAAFPGWAGMLFFLLAVLLFLDSRKPIWIILCSALLIFIKIRFAGLSAGLLLMLFLTARSKHKYRYLLYFVVASLAVLVADSLLLNGRFFWLRYGNTEFLMTILIQPMQRFPEMIVAVLSTMVDIESGLLWKAPWVLAGLAGLPVLWRKDRKLLLWLAVPALSYYLFLIYWKLIDWAGFPSASGRMLLPLVPVLIASMGTILRNRNVRYLIWISLGLAAIYFVHPNFRFNYGDGSDALVSHISGIGMLADYLPSAIRLKPILLIAWSGLAAAAIWMLKKNPRIWPVALAAPFLLIAFASGGAITSWEAEDLPPEMRQYCSLYPRGLDPGPRNYWIFSREKMLYLSSPEDGVTIPVPASVDDSLELHIFLRSLQNGPIPGIRVCLGDETDSIFVASRIIDPPGWLGFIREGSLPLHPENLEEIQLIFNLPSDPSSDILISPLSVGENFGEQHGIYLDRIEIR